MLPIIPTNQCIPGWSETTSCLSFSTWIKSEKTVEITREKLAFTHYSSPLIQRTLYWTLICLPIAANSPVQLWFVTNICFVHLDDRIRSHRTQKCWHSIRSNPARSYLVTSCGKITYRHSKSVRFQTNHTFGGQFDNRKWSAKKKFIAHQNRISSDE